MSGLSGQYVVAVHPVVIPDAAKAPTYWNNGWLVGTSANPVVVGAPRRSATSRL